LGKILDEIQIIGNEKSMIKLSIKTLDWAPKFHVLSKYKPKCQSHKEILNTCSNKDQVFARYGVYDFRQH
jgi:hypothetical protein